ncbi:MAG: MFS transporter [Anaerolineaceae bacterium]|nr:MFS transporter [Anaerolineaceae bacterium]
MTAEERRAWRVWLLWNGGQALLSSLAFTAIMIYRITEVGLSPLELVLVGTVMEMVVFLFEIPTGVVADVHSRRLSMLIGTVLIGLAFILEGLVPAFGALLLAQAIWGLGYTFTSGASEAWISDEIGEEAASRAFLRGAQAGTVAGLLGIVGSILLASIQINLPIVLAGVLMLALAGLLALVMPERHFSPLAREERDSWRAMRATLRAGLDLLRRRPVLRLVLLVELIAGLYSEGYERLWQKHILDSFTLPTVGGLQLQPVAWFGLYQLVASVGVIGLTELLGRRVRLTRQGPVMRALLLLNLAIVAGIAVFSLTDSLAVAALALLVLTATRAAAIPVSNAWLNQSAEPEIRATLFSLHGQVNSIGQVVGGPPAGLIGQRSLRAALLASGVVQTCSLPLLGLALRRAPAEAGGDD